MNNPSSERQVDLIGREALGFMRDLSEQARTPLLLE